MLITAWEREDALFMSVHLRRMLQKDSEGRT
jgi:hypothetical protein